jgi:hypothetical protein
MPIDSATEWVHVFEEDTADGRVFRRADADIPLSRRPRQRLELRPDGSAVLSMPGPDDRPVATPGRWTEEDGELVVRDASDRIRFRISERTPDRLLIRHAVS